MRLTYDPDHNVAYLRFRDKPAEVETVRVNDEVNVDITADGNLYRIELMNANSQLAGDADGTLVLINELSGERISMPLLPQ